MKFLSVFLLMLIGGSAVADIDAHDFKSAEQEQRYRAMIAELRCPKCQNQNIADSDAPLAKDLRTIVYEKVQAGESDTAIRDFMQQRYGDFILYQPPVKPSTWFLWFGPVLLLLIVVVVVRRWLVRQRAEMAKPLSPEEQQKLNELLKDEGRSS